MSESTIPLDDSLRTFGTTACRISVERLRAVTGEDDNLYIARAYVDGQPIVAYNRPVEITGTSLDGALADLNFFLSLRFGPPAPNKT